MWFQSQTALNKNQCLDEAPSTHCFPPSPPSDKRPWGSHLHFEQVHQDLLRTIANIAHFSLRVHSRVVFPVGRGLPQTTTSHTKSCLYSARRSSGVPPDSSMSSAHSMRKATLPPIASMSGLLKRNRMHGGKVFLFGQPREARLPPSSGPSAFRAG